jgi:lipid A ethanolaminephosphotransferase
MISFGVVIDKEIIISVASTNYSEVFELFSLNMFLFLIFLGLLPSWVIYRVKITIYDRKRSVCNLLVMIFITLMLLFIGSSYIKFTPESGVVLRSSLLPANYIRSAIEYTKYLSSHKKRILLPDGKFKDNKKSVVVLVVGESARRQNFSLYGYPKNTNPLLIKEEDLLVLPNTKSCATFTMGSIPCILSPSNFYKNENAELIPDYLARQGAKVIWRSNNKIPINRFMENFSGYESPGFLFDKCKRSDCPYDGVLLEDLRNIIESEENSKLFIVLHTRGSHSKYVHRYPKSFSKFNPVCSSGNPSSCKRSNLINTYDNTILYTDYFLSDLINVLKKLDNIPSAMIYISDHGESLGEGGIYAHSAPYPTAPSFQTSIPFLFWASDDFQKYIGVDIKYLKKKVNSKHNQFNVFHTILGAFKFDSSIYNPKMDILKS